jgi:hypothetical protein
MRPFQACSVRCESHPIHKLRLFAGMDPDVVAETSRRPSIHSMAVTLFLPESTIRVIPISLLRHWKMTLPAGVKRTITFFDAGPSVLRIIKLALDRSMLIS